MKIITIRNKETNALIADNIGLANTMITRFVGLMNKKKLEDNEGILLTPCSSIHMMFMKFPLDIVFLDKKNKVIKIIENIKPWKISPVVFMAQSVLELPSGTVSKIGLKINDILDF